MSPIFRLLVIALICILLSSLCSPAVFSQPKSPKIDPSQADEPTVISLLALARDFAETPSNEIYRLPLRYRVAMAIKKTRQELSFGIYVHDSISFWEEWNPTNHWATREAARRRAAVEEKARKIFLSGDHAEARRLLDLRNCQFWINSCNPDVDQIFLSWEAQAGLIEAAERRLKETVWESDATKLWLVTNITRAYFDAGKRTDALRFLSEMRSSIAFSAQVAILCWLRGAPDEAKQIMREVIARELKEAEQDLKKGVPVHLAGIQWQMGDKEGALATFELLQKFDKDRLKTFRAALAGRFALAGLDEKARTYLDGSLQDRSTLANIAVGQARRGDYDAAFKTLEHIKDLPAQNNPGHAAVQQPHLSNDEAFIAGTRMALITIMRLSARTGELSQFRRATRAMNALNTQPPRPWTPSTYPPPRMDGPQVFAELTQSGHAKFAVEIALATTNVSEKIAALCLIAETIGQPAPPEYPFVFFESW